MFAHCLEQPTRTASLTSLPRRYRFREQPASPSLFGLAPGGVCHAVSVAGHAVRSYRTFSPLLAPPFIPLPQAGEGEGGGSGSFSVALSLGSPPPGVIRHRMSMEPGLSSSAAFRRLRERPSGRLTAIAMEGDSTRVKGAGRVNPTDNLSVKVRRFK
jgi:hypothetical protein